MTVFYSMCGDDRYGADGRRDYTFTRYLGNIIFDDLDISYWIIPGTFVDDEDNLI